MFVGQNKSGMSVARFQHRPHNPDAVIELPSVKRRFFEDVGVILLIKIRQPDFLKPALRRQGYGEIPQFVDAGRLGQPVWRRAAQRIPEPDDRVVRCPPDADIKMQRFVAGNNAGESFFPRPIEQIMDRARNPAAHRCLNSPAIDIEYRELKDKRFPGGRPIGPLAGTGLDAEQSGSNFLRPGNPCKKKKKE